MKAKEEVKRIFLLADIEINGPRPWDIQVHDERFYRRLIGQGSLGLGESYMDGWWDTPRLDEFFNKFLLARLHRRVLPSFSMMLLYISSILINQQNKKRAFVVGERHYDIGNDLYSLMLDKRLTYTCGYWRNAPTLDIAQEHKLDLICRKLGLKAGQHLLDIGCGWGSLAKYAALKYGVKVTGVTISKEQAILARELVAGLPVEIEVKDYRDIEGMFDHIVSVGMFEHVGYKNYRTYMEIVAKHLKDDGLFLLHTVGGYATAHSPDPWVAKYIFPNSMLPSISQIGRSIEQLFVVEDWHNFGTDYDKTLMAWHKNFDSNWVKLEGKYNERFRRMWNYYLLMFAGSFRSRYNQLWQIVLSKGGVKGGYQSVR